MKILLPFALMLVLPGIAAAGLLDALGLGKRSANPTGAGLGALSQEEVVDGLKQALGNGIQKAVAELGRPGGFLTNLNVRIPMPEKLQKVERGLRALGQDKLADEFVATMNHAAEQAVPEAAGVFADAVKRMSIQDATAILTGPTNAATQYFRRSTETNLFQRFLPIVKTATDRTGVTATYKRLMERVDSGNALGSLGRTLLGAESVDVDSYVTQKALDGLFKVVSAEESRIRADPVARTTDLLKKVFGAIRK